MSFKVLCGECRGWRGLCRAETSSGQEPRSPDHTQNGAGGGRVPSRKRLWFCPNSACPPGSAECLLCCTALPTPRSTGADHKKRMSGDQKSPPSWASGRRKPKAPLPSDPSSAKDLSTGGLRVVHCPVPSRTQPHPAYLLLFLLPPMSIPSLCPSGLLPTQFLLPHHWACL